MGYYSQDELSTIIATLVIRGESCESCRHNNDRYGDCPYEDLSGTHPKPDVSGVKICHKHSNGPLNTSNNWQSYPMNNTSTSGGTYSSSYSGSSNKIISSSTIILLTLFLGWLGIHRFYAGKTLSGILYAISLGFIGIGVAIDLGLIATGNFDDSVEEVSESEKKVCWIMCIIIIVFILALHVF